eukprot:63650_1
MSKKSDIANEILYNHIHTIIHQKLFMYRHREYHHLKAEDLNIQMVLMIMNDYSQMHGELYDKDLLSYIANVEENKNICIYGPLFNEYGLISNVILTEKNNKQYTHETPIPLCIVELKGYNNRNVYFSQTSPNELPLGDIEIQLNYNCNWNVSESNNINNMKDEFVCVL